MTDFNKVKHYYSHFDEKNRLRNDNSGKLEYLMTMQILEKYLPGVDDGMNVTHRQKARTDSGAGKKISILDLGGGAGVYSFPLAKAGYEVTLADLSEDLLAMARKQKEEDDLKNLVSCDHVNATDLCSYKNDQFDVVLLFGPLYHLLENDERQKCVAEVYRVLKPCGKVFASFIPYLSGSIALVSRFCWSPEQVSVEILEKAFESGKFNNLSDHGFQEGYYPKSEEIEKLFAENGFNKINMRSIRGFGYEKEDMIFKFKNKSAFKHILELINQTACDKSIIETCGHAMYIGEKNPV